MVCAVDSSKIRKIAGISSGAISMISVALSSSALSIFSSPSLTVLNIFNVVKLLNSNSENFSFNFFEKGFFNKQSESAISTGASVTIVAKVLEKYASSFPFRSFACIAPLISLICA